jgi:hemerythrin-like domain-containing protein
MDALHSLAADHRLIRQTLDAFEVYVGYIEAHQPVERFDLQRFVAFFEDFADQYHHGKEETLLFPALVAAGLDWNAESLLRVRSEHDQEHYLMRSLSYSGLQGEAWSEEDRRHFLSVAKEFISFQRNHMRFENTEIFPRIEDVLSEHARLRLTREIERYDAACRSKNNRVTDAAEILMRRYTLNDRSHCEGTNRVDRDLASGR